MLKIVSHTKSHYLPGQKGGIHEERKIEGNSNTNVTCNDSPYGSEGHK